MSSFFITGATGYIGSAISKKLISDGEAVTVIVRDSKRLEPEILSSAEIIIADITDQEKIFRITERYDYIIHCAAPTKSLYHCKWNRTYTKFGEEVRREKYGVSFFYGSIWTD